MTILDSDRKSSPILFGLGLAATLGLAACASKLPDELTTPYVGGSPVNTGTYPNLNIPPQAAAEQLTPQEKAAKLAALRAAQRGQTPPPAGETPEARKRRLQLLADEQQDTLNVIEKK